VVLEEPARKWIAVVGLAVAAPIGALVPDLKTTPAGWSIAVIALATALTWRQPGSESTFVRRLLIGALVWLAVLVAGYALLVKLQPPVVGHHRGMPVGQFLAALAAAAVLAPLASFVLYRRVHTRPREESAIAAIVVVVAIAVWAAKLAAWV
jgi:MFS family permease